MRAYAETIVVAGDPPGTHRARIVIEGGEQNEDLVMYLVGDAESPDEALERGARAKELLRQLFVELGYLNNDTQN